MAQKYTVQKDDTLFKLAERFYGDGNRWEEISRANGNIQPPDLKPGQILYIPPSSTSSSPPSTPPIAPSDDTFNNPYAKRIIGYFENWAQWRHEDVKFFPDQIKADLFTHINFAFANFGFISKAFPEGPKLTGDFKIQPHEKNDTNELYPKLQSLKENRNLKTLISIGGWNFNEPTSEFSGKWTFELFSRMAASREHRKEFIESAIAFAQKYGFDGIDIDWEYPGDERQGGNINGADDFGNFRTLLAEFRDAIGGKNLLLTIAAPAIVTTGVPDSSPYKDPNKYFEWLGNCATYLDWVNIMAYDYHGAFDSPKKTGVLAPLYESAPGGKFYVDRTLTNYLQAEIPHHKIVLGMPTYGRTYMLKDRPGNLVGPGQEFTEPGTAGELTREEGVLSYIEIAEGIQSGRLERGWDNNTGTPYAYDKESGLWITYDDEESLKLKSEYAGEQGLGGIMLWAIGQDDFRNGYPLIAAARSTFLLTITDFDAIREKEIDILKNSGFSDEMQLEGGEHPWADINDNGIAVQVYIDLPPSRLEIVERDEPSGDHNRTVDTKVIQDPGSLKVRMGLHTSEGLFWGPSKEIVSAKDRPEFPKVALNNQGYFVVVMENAHNRGNSAYLHYVLGKIEGKTIHVLSGYNRYEEEGGIRPSVTLTDNNEVIEIHQAGYRWGSQDLWYKYGKITGTDITWNDALEYGTAGRQPDLAVYHRGNNSPLILVVHRGNGNSNVLHYRVSTLNDGIINGHHDQGAYDGPGQAPSVAIDREGRFITVHKSASISDNLSYDNIWYRSGQLDPNNGQVSWDRSDALQYGIGETPCIALAGRGDNYLLLETHDNEKFNLFGDWTEAKTFASTSIPRVHELLEESIDFRDSIGLDLGRVGLQVDEEGELELVPLELPPSTSEKAYNVFKFIIQFVPIIGDITSIVENSIKCNQGDDGACVDVRIDAAFFGMNFPVVSQVAKATIKGTGKALATGLKGIKATVKGKKYTPDEVADAYRWKRKNGKKDPTGLEPMWRHYEKRLKRSSENIYNILPCLRLG